MKNVGIQDLALGKRLYLSVEITSYEVFGTPDDPRIMVGCKIANDTAAVCGEGGELQVSSHFLLTEDN